MKKILRYLFWMLVSSGTALGLAVGGLGISAEYDSNVFNDYWGGGSLSANAYLDLGLDLPLGLSGFSLGADYRGEANTYLQYSHMEESSHEIRLLFWRDLGNSGYVALGGGLESGINGRERAFYDYRSPFGMAEAKVYWGESALMRFSAQAGRQSHPGHNRYDHTRFLGDLSATLFLPTKTSLAVMGRARYLGYNHSLDTMAVPQHILHLEPGFRLTQALAPRIGLAGEYSFIRNQVSTGTANYQPDTLLVQVQDYFDYNGGKASAKLTALVERFTLVAGGTYHYINYSHLEAFGIDSTGTASLYSRPLVQEKRRDRITTLLLSISRPISSSLKAVVNMEYTDHRSNDSLFDYQKTAFGLGLEYSF